MQWNQIHNSWIITSSSDFLPVCLWLSLSRRGQCCSMSHCHTERQQKVQHACPSVKDNNLMCSSGWDWRQQARNDSVSLFILWDSWWSDTVHVPCCIERSIQLFGCLCCCFLLQLAQRLGQMRLQNALPSYQCVCFCACTFFECAWLDGVQIYVPLWIYEVLTFVLLPSFHLFGHSKI